MKDKYIRWFCKEISKNWKESVQIKPLYNKFMKEFMGVDQDTALDCMAKAIKIVGMTRKYGR